MAKGNTYPCGCRCNERLKAETDGSTRLVYPGFRGDAGEWELCSSSRKASKDSVVASCRSTSKIRKTQIYMGVGVRTDEKLELRDRRASHTRSLVKQRVMFVQVVYCKKV